MLTFALTAARFILPVITGLYVLVVVWFLVTDGAPIGVGSQELVRAEMGPDAASLSTFEKLLRFLPHLVNAYALLQLWFLFGNFLKGRTFSEAAVNHLTRFGLALTASTAVSIVLNSVFGDRFGNTGFVVDQNQLFQLLIGFVFLLIARAFARARGNAEELERYF